VLINKKLRPLMIACTETTASLAKSFVENKDLIVYPRVFNESNKNK